MIQKQKERSGLEVGHQHRETHHELVLFLVFVLGVRWLLFVFRALCSFCPRWRAFRCFLCWLRLGLFFADFLALFGLLLLILPPFFLSFFPSFSFVLNNKQQHRTKRKRKKEKKDKEKMVKRILVTNDDGIRAPGIIAIVEAVCCLSSRFSFFPSPQKKKKTVGSCARVRHSSGLTNCRAIGKGTQYHDHSHALCPQVPTSRTSHKHRRLCCLLFFFEKRSLFTDKKHWLDAL